MSEIDLARAEPFTIGPFRVNPPTLEVKIGERREIIEPRIMQVFVALVRRKGEVVSRDELIAACWASRAVGDDAITRCVARLRRLAKADGGFAIETIPRVGYRLKETTPAKADAPVPAWRRLPRFKAGHIPPIRFGRRGVTITAVLVLMIVTTMVYQLSPKTLQVTAPALERVAVLPFETLSSGDDVRYFADGVADQIVGVLNANQVQAVSRPNSAALRGADRDKAAGRLGVDFILDGTVQRGAKGLRVTVHLDRASTHATLWSTSFEGAGEDPIALQAQVAAKAVDQAKAALQARGIDDMALAAFLAAQEYAREGGKAATMMRRELLETVVRRAPRFSLGHSGYALTTAALLKFATPAEKPRLAQQARQSAERALELDRRNGEAYFALIKLVSPLRHIDREALFQKALAVDPDEPTLNSAYGGLLAQQGRLAKALEYQQRAATLDPLSPQKNASLASALALVGRLAEARATIERASRLWPNNPGVWMTRLYILGHFGYPEEALAMLDDRKQVPIGREAEFITAARLSLDAIIDNTAAKRAAARRAILAANDNGRIETSGAIEILSRIGDVDTAFALADREFGAGNEAEHDTFFLFRPTTAAMRSDPRFRALMVRLKFFEAWSAGLPLPDFCSSEDVPLCREVRRS